jgi:thiaminase/transcriptional activator TenA
MGAMCERLRDACGPIWDELLRHPFVVEMAQGVLPERKFAFYIAQNILYLPEFARLLSLGVAKADDEATMIEFAGAAVNVLTLEIPKNRELLASVRELEPSAAEAALMAPTTLAYTGYLLSVGYSGRAVDIAAAMMPCSWSYGEIGRRYVDDLPEHPVYRDWIGFFAGESYWQPLAAARAQLERLCAGVGEQDFARLAEIFTTSARLERAFWDMAYNETQWPDVQAVTPLP